MKTKMIFSGVLCLLTFIYSSRLEAVPTPSFSTDFLLSSTGAAFTYKIIPAPQNTWAMIFSGIIKFLSINQTVQAFQVKKDSKKKRGNKSGSFGDGENNKGRDASCCVSRGT